MRQHTKSSNRGVFARAHTEHRGAQQEAAAVYAAAAGATLCPLGYRQPKSLLKNYIIYQIDLSLTQIKGKPFFSVLIIFCK